MARPRESAPETIYHVFAHSVPEITLFGDDHERRRFLAMLREAKELFGFSLYAFCLMSNHFHLLIRTAATGITEIMHSLLTRYAWLYNARRARRGCVFDDRFKSPSVDNDAYFLAVAPYIHRNPVSAGIVAAADQWRWSSHNAYMTGVDEFGIVDWQEALSWFGDTVGEARARYLALLDRGGTISDVEIEAELMRASSPVKEPVNAPQIASLEEIALRFCLDTRVSIEDLRGARSAHDLSRARRGFAAAAARGGVRPSDIARFLGRPKSLISRFLREAAIKSEK